MIVEKFEMCVCYVIDRQSFSSNFHGIQDIFVYS